MDLVSLRIAAGGGSIDGLPASQLVAAGFTLLQRSPALVRALAGRRAGILLPPSAQFLVALAASEGRGAVLLNAADASSIPREVRDADIGAILTIGARSGDVPAGLVHVLLDDAPRAATVVDGAGVRRAVDLGSHFGLDLEGDGDAPGRDEECLRIGSAVATHRELLALARATTAAPPMDGLGEARWGAPSPSGAQDFHDLAAHLIAPLMAGMRIVTR